jgi:hypothetical protein
MELNKLKQFLDEDLKNKYVSPKSLLGGFVVINENSRHSMAWQDPSYMPFYVYLGKYLKPKNLFEYGFNIALSSGCFLRSCKDTENFLAFQPDTGKYYTPKFGISNIKKIYKGNLDFYFGKIDERLAESISKKQWDLAIFNEHVGYEEGMKVFELLWDNMNLGGMIVMDYINDNKDNKQIFNDFVKIKNIKPIFLNTRYMVGIIQR